MKRTIFCIIICFLGITFAYSQSGQQAKKVLDKAASVLKSSSGASANFSISNGKIGKTSGTITIKGNKFKVKTPAVTVWFNGKTQWTYMSNNEEVNITTPTKAQQQAMNPYAFINIYRSGYNMSMKAKGNQYEVHLVAQKKNSSISEMYISVNKSSYTLSQVKMKQGQAWSNISVSNFKTRKLSDSNFTFNSKEYPNAEVIDLR